MTMKTVTTDPLPGRGSARASHNEPTTLEHALALNASQALPDSLASNADHYASFLDELIRASGLLARRRAATITEVVAKIEVWRALACEDALDPERASPEERLLLSIIDDVEALAR